MSRNVRDSLADSEYFTQLICKQEGYLAEDLATIDQEIRDRGKRAAGPIWNLIDTQLLMAEVAYSRGDNMSEVQARVQSGLSCLKYMPDLHAAYPELKQEESSFLADFRYLYFASAFNIDESTTQLVVQYVDFFGRKDPIVDFLRSTITGEDPKVTSRSELESPILYERLWKAISAPDKEASEAALYEYLVDWYSDRESEKGAGIGLQAHKKMIRYRGYWCWEAAAFAVALEIDDTRFRNHEHFPTDLADWARRSG